MATIIGGQRTNLEEADMANIGSVRDKNLLKEVVVALLSKVSSTKYKTEIIKLCFILDYLYCKRFGTKEGPTTVSYVRYNYGPYSEVFIEVFEELAREGKIAEVSLPFGAGYCIARIADTSVSAEVQSAVKEAVDKFGTKSLRELKSFIYELEEFKKTDFGKEIVLN